MMNMNGNHSVRTWSVCTMILNRDTHTHHTTSQNYLQSWMSENYIIPKFRSEDILYFVIVYFTYTYSFTKTKYELKLNG